MNKINLWLLGIIHLVIGLLLLIINFDVIWFISYTILSYILAIIINKYYRKIEDTPKKEHSSKRSNKDE